MKLYKPVIVRKEVEDSHYYFVDGKFFPSVTTILSETLPTPFALRYWIGEVGNEFAAKRLQEAGERGTKIHEACGMLIKGEEINLEKDFPEKRDKKTLVGFLNWFADYQPQEWKAIPPETTVASSLGYAGTLDYGCLIKDKPFIIDFKTSASIYDSHKLQTIAYQNAVYEMTGVEAEVGILHLNPRVKKGYTFHTDLEIKNKPVTIEDFLKVFAVYKMLNGGVIKEPDLTEIYPPIIRLEQRVEE